MKIVVFNTVALNGGDAAILEASVQLLREAFGEAVEISVYDKDGPVAQRYLPVLAFRRAVSRLLSGGPGPRTIERGRIRRIAALLRLRAGTWCLKHRWPLVASLLLPAEQLRAAQEYVGADLLVSTGGTYLVEHRELARYLDELRFALLCGPPLVLFPQSLGPFTTPTHRRAVRRLLGRARLVLLRDEQSRRHLEELPVRGSRIEVVADAAFALALPVQDAARPAPPGSTRLRVAVSVRTWPEWIRDRPEGATRFRAALGELATHLVARYGALVTFVSTCQGTPEYWLDDARVAAEIAEALPIRIRESVTVNHDRLAPPEFAGLMATQTLVVATRMHAAILALAVGTPVLPISYEFKTEELFRRLGLGEWVQDIRDLNGRDLTRAVDGLIAALPAIQQRLEAAVAVERSRAHRCIPLVREAMGPRGPGGRSTVAVPDGPRPSDTASTGRAHRSGEATRQ